MASMWRLGAVRFLAWVLNSSFFSCIHLSLGASIRTLMSLLWSKEYVLKSQKARGLNSLNSNTSLLSQRQFWSCGKILLTALADWFLLVRFLMPQRFASPQGVLRRQGVWIMKCDWVVQ